MLRVDQFLHVQDMIGEMTCYVELTRAAIIASEAGAKLDANGFLIPDKRPIIAHRNTANRWYPKIKESLQLIFAGHLMYLPAMVDAFDSPRSEDLQKYYQGVDVTAQERIETLKTVTNSTSASTPEILCGCVLDSNTWAMTGQSRTNCLTNFSLRLGERKRW